MSISQYIGDKGPLLQCEVSTIFVAYKSDESLMVEEEQIGKKQDQGIQLHIWKKGSSQKIISYNLVLNWGRGVES